MTNSSDAPRIILHVDMDHFFSAIEEREHPELKGQPVVVGADPKNGVGRGVVKTCNYEARAFRIHSGMPISQAWQLCPQAIYVRANYPLYKQVSRSLMAILGTYSDKFQPWGFDEAFLDVTSEVQDIEAATQLAVSVKHAILWHERLTCSIGIAPNKLVAKIASDFTKPDGLTVVPDDTVETFLAPLPVRKMLWIGGKTERKLNRMGIKTIGDLAEYDVSVLVEKFGVMGRRFHQWAHGTYLSEVGARKGHRKSIGHESTFAANTDDPDLVLKRIDDMCQRIHERMVKHGMFFRTVVVKIRFGDFQTLTSGKTLHFSTNRLQELQKTARALLKNHLGTPQKVRLVGVRVSNLRCGKGQECLKI